MQLLSGGTQAAPSAYSHSFHHLQQAQQAFATAADYDLKRRYLSLLPPQQIIEICLSFDIHVPPYAKSTIWPVDFNAAIAALQNTQQSIGTGTENTSSQGEQRKDKVPLMDSLSDPSASSSSAATVTTQESHKSPGNSTESPGPPPHSTPPVSAPPTPATPQPAAPLMYPPHPRYGYSAQPAYPHTPYYPPQHVWPPYPHPHLPYPPPSYPAPGPYPTAPHMPQPAQPPPPPQQQSYPDGVSPDDLPSYEDMIVEALNDDVTDPEGLAPKDLYTWVASHYPVQSNFRASASQALQKAFRRGRFEKSSGGKYRLNPEWRGGTTTRRTTRRPQTLATATAPATSQSRAPPFTNAPLNHNQHRPFSTNPPYMYGYPPPNPASQETPPQAVSIQREEPSPEELSGELGDAYEAAQHILKAINFGELLQISQDSEERESSGEATTANVSASVENIGASVSPLAESEEVAGKGNPAQGTDDAAKGVRAELQAQLALLAAQLSEIAHEPHETQQSSLDVAQAVQQRVSVSEGISMANMEDSDDDEEMDEVVV